MPSTCSPSYPRAPSTVWSPPRPYWGLRDYGTGRWVGGDPQCRHSTGRGSNVAQTRYPAADVYPASAAHRGGNPSQCRRCGARRHDQQLGLEPDPDSYIASLRAVFDQLRRTVAATGTVWLNLGDSYSAEPPGRTQNPMRASTLSGRSAAAQLRGSVQRAGTDRTRCLARKNLIGMPWRVAFALQQDGWIVRNAIVWHKPNAMPESVQDRVSTRYEFMFLLTPQQKYYFDLDAIREPVARPEALNENIVIGGIKGRHAGVDSTARRRGQSRYGAKYTHADAITRRHGDAMRPTGQRHNSQHRNGKNPGDVWSIPTRPLTAAHFAAFPVDLPLRCIAAGCPEGGTVLDPFSGAATTGLAARQLGRRYIGIDLNAEFNQIAKARLLQQPQHSAKKAQPHDRPAGSPRR
ncbi:DNA-methyltransferase [Haloechinothrix salitolerans]|uniref:Methyltransferase n=1 Tax=Haloechinothrix salitolerans TaxID=926830 RepID=A0ABW2C465_9PSEU